MKRFPPPSPPPSPPRPTRDWPDDTRYLGRCSSCEEYFLGPKRAFQCWMCWAPRIEAENAKREALHADMAAEYGPATP